jgi:hypothetical protein
MQILGSSRPDVILASKEKAPARECRGFTLLAPRPGLEPGTYGLKDNRIFKDAMLCAFVA